MKPDDPNVLATVYRKRGRSLIALAHWLLARPRPAGVARAAARPVTIDGQPGRVHLKVDWKALGLDPATAVFIAPAIDHFQPAVFFGPTEAIPVEPGKWWLLVAQKRPTLSP